MEEDVLARKLGEIFGKFPFIYGAVAGFCIVIARRMYVRLRPAHQTEGLGPPVVYLRSFYVDQGFSHRPRAVGRPFSIQTEEEQLLHHFACFPLQNNAQLIDGERIA